MKNILAAVILFAASFPCFSQVCFDSPEYKEGETIAKAANSDAAAQLGRAVDFLMTTKGLNSDQALREIMRFSTPETLAYDKALAEVGAKIGPMNPQSPEECAELIKLQRQHVAIGKEKIRYIIDKVVGR